MYVCNFNFFTLLCEKKKDVENVTNRPPDVFF